MHAARIGVLALVSCVGCTGPDGSDDGNQLLDSDSDGASTEAGETVTEPSEDTSGGETPETSETSSGADADAGESSSGGAPDLFGEELFTAVCAGCHGPDGAGTELAYDIRHPDREYARWVVRNGRVGEEFGASVMAAYPEAVFSDAQLDSVFDWLDALPQPDTGEGLFLDYCRNCHGADAGGGVVGKAIEYEGLADALHTVREGNGANDYGARTIYMSAFGAERLSDDEVALILEHIGGG